jgi:hypothetical protein
MKNYQSANYNRSCYSVIGMGFLSLAGLRFWKPGPDGRTLVGYDWRLLKTDANITSLARAE